MGPNDDVYNDGVVDMAGKTKGRAAWCRRSDETTVRACVRACVRRNLDN